MLTHDEDFNLILSFKDLKIVNNKDPYKMLQERDPYFKQCKLYIELKGLDIKRT